ncbi:glycosylphosphatidylinositol-anchored lipid protein transfer 7 [Hibiscus trionum]|uniref:Glycosylphosphatidylinositol-anchored lipid protein transfer 7 n=1 Tax=Hibiscus trionum TaxID=183268 RepID=A0A9W7IZD5_HIBTR|nr:glycosylphosphatidylinositol-anchored lipid protein transfer 7 [Hibiscus trionum]
MGPKMLMMAVVVMMAATARVTDAQASCAQSLVPCAPYLSNATAQPGDDCCNPIREAVATQLTCLCNLFNDPALLNAFNVSVSAAMRIARDCGVNVDVSACTNATSPTSAPPPPPGQRGDDGGADRVALTGITALFLVLVSIALY